MKNHDGCIRGFHVLSEAWYGNASLRTNGDIKDEIMIGMYHPDGGTSGEFAIRWTKVGDNYTPRLEVFSDAWHALWMFADLLERLPDFDGGRVEVCVIASLLRQLGIKDLTDRSRPKLETPPPRCLCCKQPLPSPVSES